MHLTTLIEVATRSHCVLHEPAPKVFIENFSGGSLILNLMIWTTPQGAGDVERTIIEGSKEALDALGDRLKPTQITRTIPPDANPSRFLEGTRPG